MNHYSFSRLDRYLTCPLSYKFEYIDKLPGEKADPLLIGGVCHDFFEAYDRHLLHTQQGSDYAAAEQIMIDTFAKFERPLKAEIFDQYMDVCWEHVKDHVLNLKTIVGIEEQIALTQDLEPCGWDAPEAWMRCKLDRLDIDGNTAIVTDYKTGWGGDADVFQLRLYAMAVCKLYSHITKIEVVMLYTRSGWEDRTVFKREAIASTEKLLRAYVKQIEADKVFKATPGRGCTTCPYGPQCPEKMSALVQIHEPKDALQIASDLLITKAKLKVKEDALESWCEKKGPLLINGVQFGHTTRESYKVTDPEAFLQTLKDAGLDPNEFYRIDTTKLKKMCGKDPTLAQVVANVIDVEVTPIFGQRQGAKPERKMPKAAKAKKPAKRAKKADSGPHAPTKEA